MDYGNKLFRIRVEDTRARYLLLGRIVLAELPMPFCWVEWRREGIFLCHQNCKPVNLRRIGVAESARLRMDLAESTMRNGFYDAAPSATNAPRRP
jgi:hypothetical protein